MTRRAKFFEVVDHDTEYLRKLGVARIGIFGSVRRGDDQDGSDYDVLVVFEEGKKTFRNFADLIDFLEERLGGTVDLVTREGLSPFIGPHILQEVEYVSVAS
jgi:predicted nucleotidyltransferase